MLCHRDYSERVVASFAQKYSLDTTEATDICLFKALHWSTLVKQHRLNQKQHHKHAHIMLCFIHFFWWQQTRFWHNYFTKQTHHYIVEVTKHYSCYVSYNIGKHIWSCWELQTCHCIIPDVNVVTGIFYYFWRWYQCTRTWHRFSRWPQRYRKTF